MLVEPADQPEGALFMEEELSARQPTPEEAAVGNEVIRTIEDRFGRLLYARVDLLPTPAGPIVLEVELVEPSLNHDLGPGSADRFAAAIVARTGGGLSRPRPPSDRRPEGPADAGGSSGG
jgi:hypothetical protein